MRRIVSVYLPQWPIERLARMRPQAVPEDRPLVLVEACERGLVLSALDPRARAAGLEEGEALADARARVPGIASRPAEPREDARALRRLALWCTRYGPCANTDGSRGLWIDVTGAAHLLGGEAALLVDLGRRLGALGLTAHLGLAPTHAAAWAVARFATAATAAARIVDEDRLEAALAPLPVAALRLVPPALAVLERLGLRTIGHLCSLPRAALRRRFASRQDGEDVLRRLDEALGRAARPLTALRPPAPHRVVRTFAEPLISPEGLAAALQEAIEELCAALAANHAGVRRLSLALFRADGSTAETGVGLSRPGRSPPHLTRLLEERLAHLDMGLGIDGIALTARRIEPLAPQQATLAQAREQDAEALARLVDNLANRIGADRVGRLRPRASHIPERAEALLGADRASLPDGETETSWRCQAEARTGLARPVLLLDRPEPIEVLAEIPEGPPVRFTWRRRLRRVRRAEGPERLAPEWWRGIGRSTGPPERTRDYYRIEDESGACFWVFREGLYQERGEESSERAPCWYLHGLYG